MSVTFCTVFKISKKEDLWPFILQNKLIFSFEKKSKILKAKVELFVFLVGLLVGLCIFSRTLRYAHFGVLICNLHKN